MRSCWALVHSYVRTPMGLSPHPHTKRRRWACGAAFGRRVRRVLLADCIQTGIGYFRRLGTCCRQPHLTHTAKLRSIGEHSAPRAEVAHTNFVCHLACRGGRRLVGSRWYHASPVEVWRPGSGAGAEGRAKSMRPAFGDVREAPPPRAQPRMRSPAVLEWAPDCPSVPFLCLFGHEWVQRVFSGAHPWAR